MFHFNNKNLFFFTSLGLSVSVSSYFLYKYIFNKQKYIIEEKKKEPYENKYYDKYDSLETVELEEEYVKGLKNSIIMENTPKGIVIMYYDFEKESFVYYCDTKNITYLYLETVARRYAINNNCKKLVIDIKQQLEDAKTKDAIKKDQHNISLTNKDKNNLFASFKNYNRKGTGGSKNINKTFTLRENANRYSYNGNINNFNMLQTTKYKLKKDSNNLTFEDFLAMQKIGTILQNNQTK
tara:strand:+ start:105 stop:818 length:714 start_codon:yes stop_codon:yes gene_type:complete